MPSVGCSEVPLRYQQNCSAKNSRDSSPSPSEKDTLEIEPIDCCENTSNIIDNESENEYEPNRGELSYTNITGSESLTGGISFTEHLSPSQIQSQNFSKLTVSSTMRPSRSQTRYNPYLIKSPRERDDSVVSSSKGVVLPNQISSDVCNNNREAIETDSANDFTTTIIAPSRVPKSRYHPYGKRSTDNPSISGKRVCNNNNNSSSSIVSNDDVCNNGINDIQRSIDYTTNRDEITISSYANINNNVSNVNGNNGIWTTSPYSNQNYHQYQEISADNENSSGGHGHQSSSNVSLPRVTSTPSSTFLYDMSTNNNNNHNNNNTTGPLANSNGIDITNGNGFHHLQSAYKTETLSSRQYHSSESPIPVETTIKNSFLTQDKVDTLCDIMLRDRNITMIEHILHDLPQNIEESENILRARAALAYHCGQYQRLYAIIDSRMFSNQHHKELQILYLNARYNEASKVRARDLGAVDKYRIRRKYALPRNIWDGEPTSYTFKDKDRKILLEYYLRNTYPSNEDKKEIQRITKLKKRQIDNWFKNRRQRDRPAAQKNINKMKKIKSPGGHLVMAPASSAGSMNSGHHYSQLPYHSPLLIDDSMEVKYPVYPSSGNPLTAAQMKSYNMNELTGHGHVSSPTTMNGNPQKHSSNYKLPRNSTKNGSGWVKGTMEPSGPTTSVMGKVPSTKRKKSSAAAARVTNNENNSLNYSNFSYQHLYNQSALTATGRSSVLPSVDTLDPARSPTMAQGQQQYTGTCSSVLLNHQAGWSTNWQPHVPIDTTYTSILPSFNHSHHAFNTEARIQVQ